ATEEGSSLQFHHSHLAKGWDKGVGYHFVIDNRTSGKQDGEIEATPRWIKQLDGAHCKASDMNSKAVGICLVGNFSEDKVSKKQMDSLVFLVETLRKYYGIPVKNIIAHGHVSGSSTDCPGKRFPWEDFKRRIR
ncbi:MAG: peptidoglycan recognition family protein, partial [Candidatus Omnitrophota bacterium]|nr:peptidoglycan recognition family protein [Candidatus Omnitrophota bacterium]